MTNPSSVFGVSNPVVQTSQPPRPRPIHSKLVEVPTVFQHVIDPALMTGATPASNTDLPTTDPHLNQLAGPGHNDTIAATKENDGHHQGAKAPEHHPSPADQSGRPETPPQLDANVHVNADAVANDPGPSNMISTCKWGPVELSPIATARVRAKPKQRVVRADDLAAQEAQELLQGTRKSKQNWKRN